MDQTESLMARARDDIDRRLIAFGDDPSIADDFRALTPGQRMRTMQKIARIALRRRVALGLE